MTFDKYQTEAAKFAHFPKEHGREYLLLGLSGETGELVNKFKKIVRGDDNALTPQEIIVDEGGDILWYLSELAHFHNVPLSHVPAFNVRKLTDRYAKLKAAGLR